MARFDNVDEATNALHSHTFWTALDRTTAEYLVKDIWDSALESKVPPTLTPDDLDFVRQDKLQAIKKLRQISGLGLKDAKDFIEAIYESQANTVANYQSARLERENERYRQLVENYSIQQEETISQLRSLVHSLVDKI